MHAADKQTQERIAGRFAGLIATGRGYFSNGEVAELRRMDSAKPNAPAYWRALFVLGVEEGYRGLSQHQSERPLATLLNGIALCRDLHDRNEPLGRALATAGWNEHRFARLMEAESEQLYAAVRHVARYLAAKDQHANWNDVERLLFHQEGDRAESVRLSISRTYYATLFARQNAGD